MKNNFSSLFTSYCVSFSLNTQTDFQCSLIATVNTIIGNENILANWTAGHTIVRSNLSETITLTTGSQQEHEKGVVYIDKPKAEISTTVYLVRHNEEVNLNLDTTETRTLYYHLCNALCYSTTLNRFDFNHYGKNHRTLLDYFTCRRDQYLKNFQIPDCLWRLLKSLIACQA